MKYDSKSLNIFDVKKNILVLKKSAHLEDSSSDYGSFTRINDVNLDRTNWIDVCPNDGNLLAFGGSDKSVKIYDRRKAKIAKVISRADSHNGYHLISWTMRSVTPYN